jgi:hypothetical protein
VGPKSIKQDIWQKKTEFFNAVGLESGGRSDRVFETSGAEIMIEIAQIAVFQTNAAEISGDIWPTVFVTSERQEKYGRSRRQHSSNSATESR